MYFTQSGSAILGEIKIPQAVYSEVVIASKGRAGSKELTNANWIHCCEVKNRDLVTFLKISLDDGEAEAIALAQETDADLLLMDDGEGRRIAESVGIEFTGTVGLLLRYYQGSYQDTKETLDELLAQGFRLSQNVYLKILEQIKE